MSHRTQHSLLRENILNSVSEILIFKLLQIQFIWEFIIWHVCRSALSPSLKSNHFVYSLNKSGLSLWIPPPNRVSLTFRKEGGKFCSRNSVRWVMEPLGLMISSSVHLRIKAVTFRDNKVLSPNCLFLLSKSNNSNKPKT